MYPAGNFTLAGSRGEVYPVVISSGGQIVVFYASLITGVGVTGLGVTVPGDEGTAGEISGVTVPPEGETLGGVLGLSESVTPGVAVFSTFGVGVLLQPMNKVETVTKHKSNAAVFFIFYSRKDYSCFLKKHKRN